MFLADHPADLFPHRPLGDEVQIGVGILFPTLALDDPPRWAATGGVAGARHRRAKLAVRVLWILLHHTGAGEALLIAQLDATQVEHAVLHRGQPLLPTTRRGALIERGDDAEGEMQAGAAVTDLCAGDERWPV